MKKFLRQSAIFCIFNFLCVRLGGCNNNKLRLKLWMVVSVQAAAILTHLKYRRIPLEVCTQEMLYIYLQQTFPEISQIYIKIVSCRDDQGCFENAVDVFSGTPNQTTFVGSTKSRVLLEIKLLSSDSMLEIIGQSKKIWDRVSLGAGSNCPPAHQLHAGSWSTTKVEIIAFVQSVPVLNLNNNSRNSFVRQPHLNKL